MFRVGEFRALRKPRPLLALVLAFGLALAGVLSAAGTSLAQEASRPTAPTETASDATPRAPAETPLGGLARLLDAPVFTSGWRRLDAELRLSQPVPWRTRLLEDPYRAVVDFRTLDWTGFDPAGVLPESPLAEVRVGTAGSGWSRMVLELTRPMGFAEAGMQVDPETGAAVLRLRLRPVAPQDFTAQSQALMAQGVTGDGTSRTAPDGEIAPLPPLGQRATRVMLDPGHGGVDPGAQHGGVQEADLTLGFARELAELLRRTGRFEVGLTRNIDEFTSLEGRISAAHRLQADVFISLHADALEGPQANGATVYTLSDSATDAASAALAERHDRDDMLGAGLDLSGTDDVVATVLMELARAETGPSTDRLARRLVGAIRGANLRMHRHPWQQAAFSVLKSPSVASVLLELGFLSSQHDRAHLRDPDWRARMQGAILTALDGWVADEIAQAALVRQ